jgi:outer membrane protein TolC
MRDKSWGFGLSMKFPLGSTSGSSNANAGENADGNRFTSSSSTSFQFFDDLSYDRRILESKINLGQGVADHQRLFNSVAIEVLKAKDKMFEAWESIRIGNGRVYFQFESLRLGRTRLGVGEIKRADLMLQETELLRAQNDLTDAVASYIIAGYELEFQAGRLPEELRFFEQRRGHGNTLLRYLILGDFDGARKEKERQDKADKTQEMDKMSPSKRDEFIMDQLK